MLTLKARVISYNHRPSAILKILRSNKMQAPSKFESTNMNIFSIN